MTPISIQGLYGVAIFTVLSSPMILVAADQKDSLLPHSRFIYTSYQKGIICVPAQDPLKPSTLGELQDIIGMALINNYKVKALGNRHSSTDIICTDGIPVNMLGIDHFKYDIVTGFVTVGAGATMGNFLERLHKVGRTIHGIPSYSDITIGGAVGTGAHGSSFHHPATLSDQMTSAVVVDGLGNVRNISEHDTLRAFRTHLGLLGILYEITVPTIPQYKLHIRNYPQPDTILWKSNTIMKLLSSNERFQFFGFPLQKR